jgi:hypothetical protein
MVRFVNGTVAGSRSRGQGALRIAAVFTLVTLRDNQRRSERELRSGSVCHGGCLSLRLARPECSQRGGIVPGGCFV